MNSKRTFTVVALLLCSSLACAQDAPKNNDASHAPALTIYNQDFGVVREYIPLELASGVNTMHFTEVTSRLEPDSVVLRDPSGQRMLQVLEQNYRNDPVSQELLLSLYEGKTLDFMVQRGDHLETIKGKVVRSGYAHPFLQNGQYIQPNYQQPIIEVDGALRFGLPGQPLFPALVGDTVLKPQLNWLLRTDKPGRFDAELSYITGGMSWHADYNLVVPEKGDIADLVGWVTITNQSGRAFNDARIKLMAGDVNKIQPTAARDTFVFKAEAGANATPPQVTEHAFDEYHLYTLQRPATLHDQETKQIEFVRATNIASKRIYVYDGAAIDWNRYRYSAPEQLRVDQSFGTQSNPKVWVMQEILNSQKNNLGMPLPKGRLRFYRRDTDGHLEFTGESEIDHTPKDETIRVYTGNAFDITGERHRTNYTVNSNRQYMDESFEIRVRNHKTEAVNVKVVEKLYRWTNWQITQESQEHKKTDAQQIEYALQIPPDGEKVITYTVHYSW